MRIIVTGATGLLGRPVMQELSQIEGLNLSGVARRKTEELIVPLNLCNFEETEAYLRREMPEVIVHLAAERRPDQFSQDPEGSRRLNVDAVAHIASVARQIEAWVLYLSTDYVFDGTSPPYTPSDAPNPLNEYGKSKYEGELALWGGTNRGAVLRVPLLYGPVKSEDESPVTALVQTARRGGEVDDWQRRYPTFTPDVAGVIRRMVELSRENPFFTGTFHWSGNELFTKYGMAQKIASLLGGISDRMTPRKEPGSGAPRPFDTRLDCAALEKLGCATHTSFDEGLRRSLASLDAETDRFEQSRG